jgi:hypothetical protein
MSARAKSQLEAELAALENQWLADQARFLKRGPDGGFEPARPINVGRCILLMVFSVIVMALLAATSLPPFVSLLGLVPFAMGTFGLMVGSSKAEALERCRTAYETQRASILRKMEAVEG